MPLELFWLHDCSLNILRLNQTNECRGGFRIHNDCYRCISLSIFRSSRGNGGRLCGLPWLLCNSSTAEPYSTPRETSTPVYNIKYALIHVEEKPCMTWTKTNQRPNAQTIRPISYAISNRQSLTWLRRSSPLLRWLAPMLHRKSLTPPYVPF
jgi:hypothetical protein